MSTDPDIELIDYICNTLLLDYSINTELLNNWQVELTDNLDEICLNEVVSDEIIIAPPIKHTSTPQIIHEDSFGQFNHVLQVIESLEDEIYIDFKIIILEVLLYLTNQTSYGIRYQYNKANIHDCVIEYLIKLLGKNEPPNPIILSQLNKILISLFEFGSSVELVRKLIIPLFNKYSSLSATSKLTLLDTVNQLFAYYPSQFDFFIFQDFQRKSIALPFETDHHNTSLKLLSINGWFKIKTSSKTSSSNSSPSPSISSSTSADFDNEDANTSYTLSTLFTIASSNTTLDSSYLKVQLLNNKQFRIELLNNKSNSRMQFSFNQQIQFKPKNQGFTHLTFTYDGYKNLNLFIDGDYSESIPCPEIYRVIHTWNKIYIGDNEYDENEFIKNEDELLLRQLTVLNLALAPAWINLLYNLGIGYSWDYKQVTNENIFHLLNQLTFSGLVNFALKVREIRGSPPLSEEGSRRRFRNGTSKGNEDRSNVVNETENESARPSSMSSTSASSAVSSVSYTATSASSSSSASSSYIDINSLVNFLALDKPSQDNVLFDTAGNIALTSSTRPTSSLLYHSSLSIHTSLFAIGGTPLLLKLSELNSRKKKDKKEKQVEWFSSSLKLLFCLLNTNWRFAREFEDLNGYGILLLLFNQYRELNGGKIEPEILSLLLSNFGIYDEFDSIILNPIGYRTLILNDIFVKEGGEVREKWFRHFELLMNKKARYFDFNLNEIHRLRVLVRFIQIMKCSGHNLERLKPSTPPHLGLGINSTALERPSTPNSKNGFNIGTKKQLENVWTSSPTSSATQALFVLFENDTSIESIRSLSLYTIYSIYYFQTPQLLTLQTLTHLLTETSSTKVLKKFSKSISIHWILLLLGYNENKDYSKQITLCGLQLLIKLLTVLGPNTIHRFFQNNHGVDVLTHYLKDWWSDDDIVKAIYRAAFESGGKLIMPEFLMILNNMAISSAYSLTSQSRMSSPFTSPKSLKSINKGSSGGIGRGSVPAATLSFDLIHFLNLYSEILQRGFEGNNSQLHEYYRTKIWLDGVLELIGQVKIIKNREVDNELNSQFQATYSKLRGIVSSVFISEIENPSKIFKNFRSLKEFSKKLALDAIYPIIFEHIYEFISISKLDEEYKNFIHGSIELLNFYLEEYLNQGYMIEAKDLEVFIDCCLSIIEIDPKRSSKLINNLGPLIILKLAQKEYVGSDDVEIQYDSLITSLLYKLVPILQVLKQNNLIDFITILLGNFLKLPNVPPSLVNNLFNLLRTCFLSKQDRFAALSNSNVDSDTKAIIEFLEILATKNDEDSLKYIQRHSTLRHIVLKNLQSLRGKVSKEHLKLNVLDMATVIGDGMSWKNNAYVESCQRDCELLKENIVEDEALKYNRLIQDQQENLQYRISSYHNIEIEMSRLVDIDAYERGAKYVLDYIEGAHRMKKRMVVEDQLSESEKLGYNMTVPVKTGQGEGGSRRESIDSKIFAQSLTLNPSKSGLTGPQTPFKGGNLKSSDSILLDEIDWEVIDEDNKLVNTIHLDDFEMVEGLPTDKNRKVIRSLFVGDHIANLWNISQINGLAPIESLMILGNSHLYLIENYFHSLDGGGVIEISDAPISLRDPYLQLVNSQSKGSRSTSVDSDTNSHKSKTWSLDKLSYITKRQFLLREVALEMFFNDGASILITCLSTKERDSIFKTLNGIVNHNSHDKQQQPIINLQLQLLVSSFSKLFGGSGSSGGDNNTSSSNSRNGANGNGASNSSGFGGNGGLLDFLTSSFTDSLTLATNKWRQGEMSNFYYLMIINTLAGRTFNDLTQYPVFPWVIADYTSETLDLSNPKSFRDLSKPMGAQTSDRANQFKERYEALAEGDVSLNPPFHYGTHYSSAMIVTSYLIRMKPFVQSYLLLQGGRFDHAERLFNSLERAWKSASKDNTTDVRELTPEFFYLPEFLTNHNHFELGKLQNGDSVNDVQLPPWSKNDPKVFIEMNRKALELPFVSRKLHLWIELIFGHKQSGIEAVKNLNVFHHLSYNGAINLDSVKDEVEKRAIIGMINNFGQTPRKIFNKPHPKKDILNIPNYYLTTPRSLEAKIIFESKTRNIPIDRLEKSTKSRRLNNGNGWIGRPKFITCENDLVVRKAGWGLGSLIVNKTVFLNVHLANITSLIQIGYRTILAGLQDGLINVWRHNKKNNALEVSGILRGHIQPIKDLQCSKTYKVAVSLDVSGTVMLWDLARLKFIRKFINGNQPDFISISNDTGNVCTLNKSGALLLYTINGDVVVSTNLQLDENITYTTINFGSCSFTGQDHIYWSCELIGIGRSDGVIEIYSLSCEEGKWDFRRISQSQGKICFGTPTALEVVQYTEIDPEDRLARGEVSVIIGDSTGRVYEW